jgi:hypothetical protein
VSLEFNELSMGELVLQGIFGASFFLAYSCQVGMSDNSVCCVQRYNLRFSSNDMDKNFSFSVCQSLIFKFVILLYVATDTLANDNNFDKSLIKFDAVGT